MTAGAAGGSTGWRTDVLLYGASTVFAVATAVAAAIPLQRAWGRTAVWGYGAATAVAAVGWLFGRRAEKPGLRWRVALAAAVFVVVAIVPLATAATRRADVGAGSNAQSEVIIVEEAADAVLDGRNPYAAEYVDGPLAERPRPTQTHVPYPPGMLAFGVPRALGGHSPWTDARVWFAIASIAIALVSVRAIDASRHARLLVLQVLLVLPTGALLLATGGTDVPVLALLLATAVLAAGDRVTVAGVVGGLALAVKQTSILFLPFVVLALPRGRARFLATAAITSLALTVPLALWDLGAFVEDAILFPLGVGDGPSAAATPTLGSMLIDLVPSQRSALTMLLVAAMLAIVVVLLIPGVGASMSEACFRAAAAFVAVVALAPAARVGYLTYPASFVAWGVAFRSADLEQPDEIELHASGEHRGPT
ncbi:MAG TPA: glycosyltransferase 87 family protein [Actinomycetota bacterium]|nr:glycosyltransferase 87 family protein [Actinomycetota bacterium]